MASSGFFVLNVNLKGENTMGNLIQYIAQEDPEKNRPWQTSVPQNNFCKTKSTILSKPKYTNPNPRRIPSDEIAKSGLEGFGQGVEHGSLSFFNAKTGGFYDVASYFFMKNDYEKRQEKMQKEAEKVGLGGLNKLADYTINIGESANILKRIKNIGAKYTKLR